MTLRANNIGGDHSLFENPEEQALEVLQRAKESHVNRSNELGNSWIAPGFESMKYFKELRAQMNGAGGSIEQLYLYLDPLSVEAWCAVASHEDYLTSQDSMGVDDIVDCVYRRLRRMAVPQESIDLLFLGAGDARQECRFVESFLKRTPVDQIQIHLLDTSSLLLESAYQRVAEMFEYIKGVDIKAVFGNFEHIPRYNQLLRSSQSSNRLKLVAMLGTFTNLENEMSFLKHSLNVFEPGTLLLIDVTLNYAPSGEVDKIHKLDPWLSGRTRWQKMEERFLSVPIRRYRKGYTEDTPIKFITTLDNDTRQVPDSYVVEMRAILEDNIHITMQRFKRYDSKALVESVRRRGWDLINTFPYYEGRRLSCLFQKKE